MAIDKLNSTDVITIADLMAIFSQTAGTDRKVSMSTLLSFVQSNLTFPSTGYTTQYASPSATGFSVPLTAGSSDIHLILTATDNFATGTLTLPAVSGLVDAQKVLVNSTKAVSALTIAANGALAVTGGPTSLNTNEFFTLKYDLLSQTWYRVG